MKKNYLLVLLCALFMSSFVSAQSCPPTGFSDGTSVYFFYDAGTSACVDRPLTITVETFTFSRVDCQDTYSIYDIDTADTLSDTNNFVADFGFGTCEYSSGTLISETLSVNTSEYIKNSVKIFPNPVTKNSDLFIVLGAKKDVEVKIYSVTGKLVMSKSSSNLSRVKIATSTFAKGVYMIQIDLGDVTVTKKLLVI